MDGWFDTFGGWWLVAAVLLGDAVEQCLRLGVFARGRAGGGGKPGERDAGARAEQELAAIGTQWATPEFRK